MQYTINQPLHVLKLTGISETICPRELRLSGLALWIPASRPDDVDVSAIDEELGVVWAVGGPELFDAEEVWAWG